MRIDELKALGAKAFAAKRAPRLVWQPDRHRKVAAIVQTGMSQVTLPGYAQAARMLAAGRLLEDASRLSTPADVVVGDNDIITPPEAAARLHGALPKPICGALVHIADAGHAIYQQSPAAFARALGLQTAEGV